MKNKYRVYLRHGVTFEVKANSFSVTYDGNGNCTEWKFDKAEKWITFSPSDFVALVEL